MLFLNAVRVEKLTVDGSAFQTLTTLSAKKFLPETGCTSGLKQFVLVTPCISDGAKLKKITMCSYIKVIDIKILHSHVSEI